LNSSNVAIGAKVGELAAAHSQRGDFLGVWPIANKQFSPFRRDRKPAGAIVSVCDFPVISIVFGRCTGSGHEGPPFKPPLI
jgi:hypothetical protein